MSDLQRHRYFVPTLAHVHALHHWDSLPEKKSTDNGSGVFFQFFSMIPNRLLWKLVKTISILSWLIFIRYFAAPIAKYIDIRYIVPSLYSQPLISWAKGPVWQTILGKNDTWSCLVILPGLCQSEFILTMETLFQHSYLYTVQLCLILPGSDATSQ